MEKKLDEADKKTNVTLLKYGIKRAININTPWGPLHLLCELSAVKKIKPQKAQRIHKGHGEKFSDRKRNYE